MEKTSLRSLGMAQSLDGVVFIRNFKLGSISLRSLNRGQDKMKTVPKALKLFENDTYLIQEVVRKNGFQTSCCINP